MMMHEKVIPKRRVLMAHKFPPYTDSSFSDIIYTKYSISVLA